MTATLQPTGASSHGMARAAAICARVLAALGLATAAAVTAADPVAACYCVPPSPAEALGSADAAFTGTVASKGVAPAGRGDWGVVTTEYVFAVDGVAKGELGAEVSVLGGGQSSACGFSFEPERRYLVFAYMTNGAVSTSLCSGNLHLAQGDDPPVPVRAAGGVVRAISSSKGGLPMALSLATVAVVAIAGACTVAFRRMGARR